MELFTQDLFRYIRDRGSISLKEASEVLGTVVSTDRYHCLFRIG